MAYSKQDWAPDASGNPKYVTPSRMNHIEQGIENVANVADKNASDISAININLVELEGNVSILDKATTTNLLNPTLTSQVINGVTITANGDGTYTLNGTPSIEFNTIIGSIKCEVGKTYKLVGRPAGAGNEQSAFAIYCNTGQFDYGNGVDFVATNTTHSIILHLHPNTGTLSNVVIKPMVTTNLSATYNDFVSYTGDTGKLNTDIADIRADVDNIGNVYTFTLGSDSQSFAAGNNTFNTATNLKAGLYLFTVNGVHETNGLQYTLNNIELIIDSTSVVRNYYGGSNPTTSFSYIANVNDNSNIGLLIQANSEFTTYSKWVVQAIRLK